MPAVPVSIRSLITIDPASNSHVQPATERWMYSRDPGLRRQESSPVFVATDAVSQRMIMNILPVSVSLVAKKDVVPMIIVLLELYLQVWVFKSTNIVQNHYEAVLFARAVFIIF